jgi:hypothetical protein
VSKGRGRQKPALRPTVDAAATAVAGPTSQLEPVAGAAPPSHLKVWFSNRLEQCTQAFVNVVTMAYFVALHEIVIFICKWGPLHDQVRLLKVMKVATAAAFTFVVLVLALEIVEVLAFDKVAGWMGAFTRGRRTDVTEGSEP